MKYVVVILDGASGWPLDELGGKTCLQAAATPHLDALARTGRVGLAQTVPQGTEPSSSAACTSILGYDPIANYVGRAAIEAASMGIELAADEVALRLNTVTITDGTMTSYAAGHISTDESTAIVRDLATALDDDVFTLYPGVSYRHILVVKGHPELLDLAYTPPHDISDRLVAGYLPSGDGTALLLDYMARAHAILPNIGVNTCRVDAGQHPVTDVWPFWPGVQPTSMIPFDSEFGVSAALTSGVDLLNGLAVIFGIQRLSISGVTDGADTDYAAQADGALAALADHDLVVIHIESPDEEGHAGNVAGKIAAIEAIDREVVSRVRRCAEEIRVLALPDHATPIEIKTHVGEPVPFVLWGPGIAPNGAHAYTPYDAEQTGLLLDPGYQVMELLLAR